MKIDIFSHIIPEKYRNAMDSVAHGDFYNQNIVLTIPTLYDIDRRLQIMDRYEGYMQVLNIAAPPIEMVVYFTK